MDNDKFVIVDILSIEFGSFGFRRISDGKSIRFSDNTLLEVAAVQIENGKIVKNFSTFIAVDGLDLDTIVEDWEPDRLGITPDHLKGAPNFEAVAEKLHWFVRDSIIITNPGNSEECWRKFKIKALACGYFFNNITFNMGDIIFARHVMRSVEESGKNFNEIALLEMANYVKTTKNIPEIMDEFNIYYPPYDKTDRAIERNDCLSRAIAFANLFLVMQGYEILSLKQNCKDDDEKPF